MSGAHAHAFELRPPHPGTAQAGDDHELQAANHLVAAHGDEQLVARLTCHLVEGLVR